MELVDYLVRLEDRIDNLRQILQSDWDMSTTNCSSIPQCRIQSCGGRRLINVINSLKKGSSPISEEVGMEIPHGSRWKVTSEFENSIEKCDLVIVCVPTPVDENFIQILARLSLPRFHHHVSK